MLMYSRKKVRYRRDGYCWKKRKDGKTTREDHMKLKVQGVEVRMHHLHLNINFTLLHRLLRNFSIFQSIFFPIHK